MKKTPAPNPSEEPWERAIRLQAEMFTAALAILRDDLDARAADSKQLLAKHAQQLNAQDQAAGRLAEGLLAPGLAPLLERIFGEPMAVREDVPGLVAEGTLQIRYQVDALASGKTTAVVVEIKNKPIDADLVQLQAILRRVRVDEGFQGIVSGKKLVGAILSTRIYPGFLEKANRLGVLCLEVGPHELLRLATPETSRAPIRAKRATA
jgi:hypothetical protein